MQIITLEVLVVFIDLVLLYLYLKASHYFHWFDKPDETRKLHVVAKPTSAGLIFMMPLLLVLFFFPNNDVFNSYQVGSVLLILMLIGGIDDFKPVSVKVRLLVISLCSYWLLHSVFIEINLFIFLIYLIGLIWWLNLYNFMDGIDGMVGLHAVITTIAYIFFYTFIAGIELESIIYMLVFLACLTTFLIFNFPVSKMFMGDSGSLSVAIMLAIFALYGISKNIFDEITVISFHLVFIIDTTLTLFTRIKFKHKLSEAHNLHFFQALVINGYSHVSVTTYYGIMTLLLVSITFYLQTLQINILLRVLVLMIEMSILIFIWIKYHNKTKFERFTK